MSTDTPTRQEPTRSIPLEAKILDGIDELRREHQSCTMRGLANNLRLTESFCRNTLHSMRKRNLVTWTPMPGSLRTIRASAATIIAPDADGTTPIPTLNVADDGTITLVWPDACGDATLVTRDVIEQMIDAHNADLGRLGDSRLELERVTAQLVESRTEALTYKGLLSKGQISALVRAKRPPTEKEIAARAEFGRKGGERLAGTKGKARKSASAPAGDAASPQGEQDAADADGGEESFGAV